jgi:deazaflavin-dependent oxidoreductase (nitroreductase family)
LSRKTPAEADQQSLSELVASQSQQRLVGRALGALVELPFAGSLLARAIRLPNRIGIVSKRVTRLHAWVLRRAGGSMRRSWLFAAGQPVLSLTTVGRRSGEPRTTAVACFVHGDDLVLAGMNLGLERSPAWALNLEANAHATIGLAGEAIAVTARRASGEEAEQLWRRWVELQPSAPALRRIASRAIPLFILTRRVLDRDPHGASRSTSAFRPT